MNWRWHCTAVARPSVALRGPHSVRVAVRTPKPQVPSHTVEYPLQGNYGKVKLMHGAEFKSEFIMKRQHLSGPAMWLAGYTHTHTDIR